MRRLLLVVFVSGLAANVSVACGSDSSSDDVTNGVGPDGAEGGAGDSSSPADSSGNGDSASGGDGASEAAPDGAVCGTAACTGIAGACGTFTDSCNQSVACEPCRFDRESLPSGAAGDRVALVVGASDTSVAFSGLSYAKRTTSWNVEPAVSASSLYGAIDLAVAADGTPWISYVTGGTSVDVAHRTPSGWVTDHVAGGQAAALAMGSDGALHLAYSGSLNTDAGNKLGVVYATYANGAWTKELVVETKTAESIDLQLAGTVPHIVWHNQVDQTVDYATRDGASFKTEPVDPSASGNGLSVHVSLALDAQGRPNVVYGSYRNVGYAVRDTTWSVSSIAGPYFVGVVRIASSPSGALAVGWAEDESDAIKISFKNGASWGAPNGLTASNGWKADFDMAFNSSNALVVVHSGTAPLSYIIQNGIYPTGYAAACSAISTGICNVACACPARAGHTGECCVGFGGSGEPGCTGPASYCPTHWMEEACGDNTQDAAAVFGCRDSVSQTVCANTIDAGDAGAVVPAGCLPLLQH